jgi:hypothetical protein
MKFKTPLERHGCRHMGRYSTFLFLVLNTAGVTGYLGGSDKAAVVGSAIEERTCIITLDP